VYGFFVRFGMLRVIRLSALAGLALALLSGSTAKAFDYARYQPADLDALADRKPPVGNGVDVYPVQSIRVDVTLVAPAAPCATGFLTWAMLTSGISKEFVQKVPISHCIQVKSAKGRLMSMFIQDALTPSLAREVPPGGKMTVYAGLVYFDQKGPGIVVNEFSGEQQTTSRNGTSDCGCGKDFHSGLDYSAPEGTPVPVGVEGIIVSIEQDEAANVDVPTAGKCGRYVVVKHSFPNGRTAFTRYAQLGRLVGNDGKPLKIGQHVNAKDRIGEVGSQGRFHFEVRPVDSATMDQTAKWTLLYGRDAGMEWTRYQPVDPEKFDSDAFSGKTSATTPGKQ
jgi:murein DD-endopeptidase MepM/ murein hydrolase activator NlpD